MPKYLLILKAHCTDNSDRSHRDYSREREVTCEADKLIETIQDAKEKLESDLYDANSETDAIDDLSVIVTVVQVLPL